MNFGDILTKVTAVRYRDATGAFDLLDGGHRVDQCSRELMADFVASGIFPESVVDDALLHPGAWVLREVGR